jgi:hypothetical protein
MMAEEIGKYIYLIPLIIALFIAVFISLRNIKIKKFSAIRKKGLIKKIIPKKSKLRAFYIQNIIKNINMDFEKLFSIKIIILASFIMLFALTLITDIVYETELIKTKKNYRATYLTGGTINNEDDIYKLEMKYIEKAVEAFKDINMKSISTDEFSHILKLKIKELNDIDRSSLDELSKRLFIRVKGYYRIREFNVFNYIFAAFLLSFLPELLLIIKNALTRNERKAELVFLKRLMIMSGSIEPVVFQDVLNILIDKSKHYKNTLIEINKNINKNSNNPEELYREYIIRTNELEEKLFFEKLQMANNYDFSLAIENIKNEFKISQRETDRKVKKRVEGIHMVGVMGIMILIFIWVLYLILPWMQRFNMEGLI